MTPSDPVPAPQTSDSGAQPYCTPAQCLDFVDATLVGQLVPDTGYQLPVDALLVDPRLANHLAAASARLELACTRRGRYRPADLAALTGNAAVLLAELVAHLTLDSLLARRGYPVEAPPAVKAARETLRDLADGQAALPFVETEAAGRPQTRLRTPVEILRAGLFSDSYQANRFQGPPRGGAYGPGNGWNGPSYGYGYGPGY